MINASEAITTMLNRPSREIKGRAGLYNGGSALLHTFNYDDYLKGFTVDRTCETSKFFGFGVVHKLTLKVMDKGRAFDIVKDNEIDVEYGVNTEFVKPYGRFYVEDAQRDENTNDITVTAYDAIYNTSKHTASELNLVPPYNIKDVATACGALMGVNVDVGDNTLFNTDYPTGANLEGTEKIRDVLDDIAEATGTIYCINNQNTLVFKLLDNAGVPVVDVTKDKYFTLKTQPAQTLASIVSSTELGDNVSVTAGTEGATQYLRDNVFLDIRDDVSTLLENILSAVGGTVIVPYNVKWRGNFLVETGDKINLTTKDGNNVVSYMLNDSISYTGGLVETSQWEYKENGSETASNPSSIGDALKQTFAKVDKANKKVDIVVSQTAENTENISAVQLDTETIRATVQATTSELDKELTQLTSKVEATMTREEVTIAIDTELSKGAEKVNTTTGYTFDEAGLTISKSGSEISTTITENGMTVNKDDDAVLTANNKGVTAIDLKATTYLIVGTNSRFENYSDNRTGCFWIGGV